jgi:uncharacterized phage infection (PIP) family protein YhgE
MQLRRQPAKVLDAVDQLIDELAAARADFSEQLAAPRAELNQEIDQLKAELAAAHDELRRLYAIEAFHRLEVDDAKPPPLQ